MLYITCIELIPGARNYTGKASRAGLYTWCDSRNICNISYLGAAWKGKFTVENQGTEDS